MGKSWGRYLTALFLAGSAVLIGCGDGGRGEEAMSDSIPEIKDSVKSDTTDFAELDSIYLEEDSVGIDTTSSANSDAKGAVTFNWKLDIQEKGDAFEGKVIAIINGKEHMIVPSVSGEYHEMEKGDFDEAEIPSNALGAIISLSGDGGEILYAQQKGDQVLIFKKLLTDMSGGEHKFKQIQKIDLK